MGFRLFVLELINCLFRQVAIVYLTVRLLLIYNNGFSIQFAQF